MITLEQIQKLDAQVKKAVSRIEELKSENKSLKKKLDDYQNRIDELEILITDFKRDQGEIEQGIINALSQLEELDAEGAAGTEASVPSDIVSRSSDISSQQGEQHGGEAEAEPEETITFEQDTTENADREQRPEKDSEEDDKQKDEEIPGSPSELDIF